MNQPRKIDTDKLLDLINQGMSLTACSKIFNCSVAAISKKLKQLNGAKEIDVLSKYNLTDREKQFVLRKASGLSATQACLETYEVSSRGSAKVLANEIMKREDVKMAIADLLASEGLTRRYRIRRLKSHIDSKDPIVSLKGLDMSFRLDGSYAPDKHVSLNIDYAELSDRLKELEKQEQEILAELEGLEG